MMLGRVLPVNLPALESEISLVQKRQNKLALDINRINTQIRNNQISASQGNRRILFKKAEIDQLEHYKRSRRTPTGRLSPPPRTAAPARAKKGPANKYNPAASDKVPGATGPADFSVRIPTFKRSTPKTPSKSVFSKTSVAVRNQNMIENDRAGMKSKSSQRPSASRPPQQTRDNSRNRANYLEADYYNRLKQNYVAKTGRNPPSVLESQMRASAKTMWTKNAMMPAKVQPTPKTTPKSTPTQKATSKAKSIFSKAKSAAKSKVSAPAPKKTLKDNPHGKSYGPTYSRTEKFRSAGKARKYNGIYYGPSSPAKVGQWTRWNVDNLSGYGGMPQAALIRRKAEMNRETTLMRMRAGAKLDLNQPVMQKRTQMRSWETYGRPEDVEMIKAFVPMMIGLDKFPELTPEGNAMMVQAIQVGNDQQKMNAVANKLATDLVNKSGYFVKKYNVEVDPLQKKVKVSEMSGLAGGLTKTRNSMQRLL